ncbi:hypothetical protein [Microbispora bryophytorum]
MDSFTPPWPARATGKVVARPSFEPVGELLAVHPETGAAVAGVLIAVD